MYSLAIHGGAGTIERSSLTKEKEAFYRESLLAALQAGELILSAGGKAIDAVKAAVVSLEDCTLFNAGKGSVYTHSGLHEMDASIMCGKTMMAGAVAGVRNIKNPVLLAETVMNKTDHVLLYGDGAEDLARQFHLEFETPEYFHDQFRYNQWLAVKDTAGTHLDHSILNQEKKFGTVGAVSMDIAGNIAAATSTGGMTNKRYHRIGDTPVIGSGNYANNRTCAVSCTGHGEFFLRAVVAYDISCLMEYKGLTLHEACQFVVLKKLVDRGGEGGIIAVDAIGNLELVFNTEGMYRGCVRSNQKPEVAIYK